MHMYILIGCCLLLSCAAVVVTVVNFLPRL